MGKIILVDKLTFRYKDRFIFDRFSLSINAGEWITITGPNGSGKSTLIKIILGLVETSSRILVCNIPLEPCNISHIRKNIGVVFDNLDNYFICETVEDELAFTLENLCYSKQKINSRISEISDMLNIKQLLNKSPNELSGGEKCRVAIGCSLVHDPKILILDETLSMIDESSREDILNILKDLHSKGITIINVTHNLKETYYSDRLIVLNDGEILLEGSPIKVMEYDKILNKLGIEIPFEIELSIKLKLYGLIDKLYFDINKMVDDIWE